MPERVANWRRVRDTVGADLRAKLDREIVRTFQQVFGDGRERLLLSLPSPATKGHVFRLGEVLYDRERGAFGLSRSELLQHLVVFGRSGAGKTNVVFLLLHQLAEREVPFLFLDWKRTARHLALPGQPPRVFTPGRSLAPFPFNPFLPPPGLEPAVYTGLALDVLGDAYTLGEGAKSILQRAVQTAADGTDGGATVSSVLEALRALPTTSRSRGWQVSAVRALERLHASGIGTAVPLHDQERVADELLHSSTVLELNGLAQSAKAFLVPLVCLWLYHVALANGVRERLRLVIIVEEAHHVLLRADGRAKESLLAQLLRQCRELGIAFVVVDQHPSLISRAVLGNCYTSICLNLKDPADVRVAGGLSGLTEVERQFLTRLPVGQGVVKLQDRWREPFLVGFPEASVTKGRVTDADVRQGARGSPEATLPRSGTVGRAERANGRVRRGRFAGYVVDADGFALVADVLEHPQDGVKARYRRLGWSAHRGTRVCRALTSAGMLERDVIPLGVTRRVVLRVAPAAQRELGLTVEAARSESLPHAFWKAWHANRLRREGWEVAVEAPRPRGVGGTVDVLARKGQDQRAVEVETGKSDVVENVRRDLLAGFDEVLVVATDEQALRTVEEQLGKAGLLGMGRVMFVLREQSHGEVKS
jgi:hypothetical protein